MSTATAPKTIPEFFSIGYASVQLQVSVTRLRRLMVALGIEPVARQNDVDFISGEALDALREHLRAERGDR